MRDAKPNTNTTSRRSALQLLGYSAAIGVGVLGSPAMAQTVATKGKSAGKSRGNSRARVVVIGGGFGGSTAARTLKALNPTLDVVLIERNRIYTACPFSNLVIAGQRKLQDQQFSWQGLERSGVQVINANATRINTNKRVITLQGDRSLSYDRLILAPGIQMRYDAIEGYNQDTAAILPHAWQAGPQTTQLRDQLRAMPDGGLVVIAVPQNPYRCPPGPYERASLIAHYLKTAKPRSKLLILDAKDKFSKMGLFQQAWKELYGDIIEWRGLSDSGGVRRVDALTQTLHTDFDSVTATVANVIPPQQAGAIAVLAGVTDNSRWCPIEPLTFESTLVKDVHVIGDAAIANAMPKSAFAANAQAKVCAAQITRNLADQPPLPTRLINTCYSLIAPSYGISVAGVYQADSTRLQELPGAGGTSPMAASRTQRRQEASYAHSWFKTITQETFG